MKSAVVVGKENIIMEDRPKPQIDSYRNVLLKILYCGICGSDMPKYYGNRIKRYPLVLGHEFCGIVEEGPNNLVGKLVSGIPMWYCGECDNCKDGNYELCSNHKYVGSTLDGAMQEYLTIPEKYVLDANILNDKPELAALIEPCAVAVHASNILFDGLKKDKAGKIGIIGDGVIGSLIYLVLRHYKQIPKDQITFITKETIPEENIFDYCFECSGHVNGLNSAIKATKYKGQIMQLGIIYPEFFKEGENLQFDRLLRKEQNLQGCWNSNFKQDWKDSLEIISKFRLEYEQLITWIYDLDRVKEAFEDKKNSKSKKIMLKVYK